MHSELKTQAESSTLNVTIICLCSQQMEHSILGIKCQDKVRDTITLRSKTGILDLGKKAARH